MIVCNMESVRAVNYIFCDNIKSKISLFVSAMNCTFPPSTSEARIFYSSDFFLRICGPYLHNSFFLIHPHFLTKISTQFSVARGLGLRRAWGGERVRVKNYVQGNWIFRQGERRIHSLENKSLFLFYNRIVLYTVRRRCVIQQNPVSLDSPGTCFQQGS